MKKFLLKVILFLILFLVTFALPIVVETVVRKHKLSLELPKDKTILFVGDSHIVKGVNDKFIPGAFNWAKKADNYLNLFVRTRKLLEANPQIRTVFITATPLILNENADNRIFSGDAGFLFQPNIIFYEREDLEDCGETIVNMLKNPRSQRVALLRAVSTKTFGTLKEFGGFEDEGNSSELLWRQIENDSNVDRDRLSYARSDNRGNALSLKYLRKIVELVRARGGRIIFLNPPIYHAEKFLDVPYFENLLKEKFPDVEFWDYADFPMPEDCFLNVNHLNGKGAEVFSKELARRMKEEGIIGDSSQPEVTVSEAEP